MRLRNECYTNYKLGIIIYIIDTKQIRDNSNFLYFKKFNFDIPQYLLKELVHYIRINKITFLDIVYSSGFYKFTFLWNDKVSRVFVEFLCTRKSPAY